MSTLTGKTALVTGSSRGIGRATARRLARDGALVAVHYGDNEAAAEETLAAVAADGGRAFAVRAELGVPGDVDTLFSALSQGLKEHHGSVALDILVNNAGVMAGSAPEDITADTVDRLYAINARAPLMLIQRCLPFMPDGGRIINISSGLTRVANPNEIAYTMSKGAIETITMNYAKHLGPRNITVNTVAPGVTDNGQPFFGDPEMRTMFSSLSVFSRVGEAPDVADVVGFLASPDARWMTGAWLDASGGTQLVGSA